MTKTRTKDAHKPAPLPGLDLEAAAVGGVRPTIPVKDIQPSPYQGRQESSNAVADLADSIVKDGLLQPVTVRPAGKGKYEVIAGHRRLAAFAFLKRPDIPATVLDVDDEAAYRLGVIENLKRVDLNPLEEARSFAAAVSRLSWSVAQVAYATNRTEAYVKGRLAILDEPEPVRNLIGDGASIEKSHLLAPLDQFKHIAGGGPDVVGGLSVERVQTTTTEDVKRFVEDEFQARSCAIESWDPEICKKAGCLGEWKGKPRCLNLRHAFEMIVASSAERMEGAVDAAFASGGSLSKHGVSREDGLPIYYQLAELDPTPRWGRRRNLKPTPQPKAYPRPPWDLYDAGSYGRDDGKLVSWSRLKDQVKGKVFKDNCETCPAFKGKGSERGRAILVKMHEGYTGARYQMQVSIELLCMVPAHRAKLGEESDKQRGGATSSRENLNDAKRRAREPFLVATVEDLTSRLVKDRVRILAMSFLQRYRMSELPFVDGKLDKALKKLGIKVPAHDSTPNGKLKALMSVGEAALFSAIAYSVVRDFDGAEQHGGEHSANAVVATTEILFGKEAAAAVKDGVRELERSVLPKKPEAKSSPKAKTPAKRTSKPAKVPTEAKRKTFEELPCPCTDEDKADPDPDCLSCGGTGNRRYCESCADTFKATDARSFAAGGEPSECPRGHTP